MVVVVEVVGQVVEELLVLAAKDPLAPLQVVPLAVHLVVVVHRSILVALLVDQLVAHLVAHRSIWVALLVVELLVVPMVDLQVDLQLVPQVDPVMEDPHLSVVHLHLVDLLVVEPQVGHTVDHLVVRLVVHPLDNQWVQQVVDQPAEAVGDHLAMAHLASQAHLAVEA